MAKREYAAIECFLFKDPRFLVLPSNEKLTWFYMLGNSSRARLPGIIEGTSITIAQYLFYPLDVNEQDRFLNCVNEAKKSIYRLVEMGWVEHDLKVGLFLLPHAVSHNLPANRNMLLGWIRRLKEVPSSPLVRLWIKYAAKEITSAFGRNDERSIIIEQLVKIMAGHDKIDVENFYAKSKGGTPLKGFYSGYPDGFNDCLSSSIASLNKKNKNTSTPPRKKPKKKKTMDVPEHFNERQRALWTLFLSEKFRLASGIQQTVFDNASDPVSLCEKLGGSGFLRVDLGIVQRLAAWSFANPKKAKTYLSSHLVNCFGREQKAEDQAGAAGQLDALRRKNTVVLPTEEEEAVSEEERKEMMRKAGFIDASQ